MIRALVDFALNNRFIVMAVAVLLLGWGAISFHNLPVEAYPDVANNYVKIITQWPGRAAEEVEQQVTIPIEIADERHSAPGASALRFALRAFQRDADFRRRIRRTTGTGRRFWSGSRRSRLPHERLQPQIGTDWSPGRADLLVHAEEHESEVRLDGAEVARGLDAREAIQVRAQRGGRVELRRTTREYQVRVDPDKLVAYGLSIGQVEQQLANNNVNAGGSFIEAGAAADQRARGGTGSATCTISRRRCSRRKNGTPLRVTGHRDVAQGPKIRLGQIGKAIHRADGQDRR